ncbi:MAG: diacylglycerol kinase family protein, partial [Planctomycetota bacterium]|nr:diacylglycerol kinase family protein [Planctomycetota bacterium]
MAFCRVLILANPIAGRGRGEERATALYAALLARDLDAQLFITGGSGEATLVARAAATGVITESSPPEDPPVEPPQHPIGPTLVEAQRDAAAFKPDLLISVGGDGTLRELLDGVAERPLPVGLLPMGTANVLALDFKLPRTPKALVDLVLAGTTRQLDLATVTGTHQTTGKPQTQTSFLAVGLGIDAEIVRRLDAARDGAITKWSYLPHAARAIVAHKELDLCVEVDGQPLTNASGAPIERVAALLLANVINFGGIVKL